MRHWMSHNLGLKVLALVLATLLWMVVVGEQKVEVTSDVPLALSIPANLFLANTPPDTLQVRLRGPKGLISSLRTWEILPATLPGPLQEGENVIPIREDFIQVPRGIQVVDVAPRRIRVVLEPAVEREVDVVPRMEGAPPGGLTVRRTTAVPARVRMIGPASEMRRLTRVQTQPINLNGQQSSFAVHVQLESLGHQIRPEGSDTVTIEVEIGSKRS